MVATQVGEHRGLERDVGAAPLLQRVGGHFHRHALDAFVDALGQHALHRDRIRRRQPSGLQLLQRAVAERTDQTGVAVRALPGLGDEMRGGCLAVGAGHAGDGEPLRRRVIETRCERRQPGAESIHFHQRNRQPGRWRQAVVDDHTGTAALRLGGEVETVRPGAGDRDERFARLHRARIQAEALDRNVRRAVGPAFQQRSERHRAAHRTPPSKSSGSTVGVLPTGALSTRVPAKPSGGMSSRRSAPLMTVANRGAATAPP